nr:DUF2799 domain-containing protein [uncultured Brevundimonas sp.]
MRRLVIISGAAAGAALMASCTTMSKDECLAGAWGEKGYADGAAGYPVTRLEEHAKACAKYQVMPNPDAYQSAREEGLRNYCNRQRGWTEGRAGNTYYGVCRPGEEAEFLPAYLDGRRLHEAEAAVESARSALNSAISRIENREDKLEAKQAELRQNGLSDEERQKIRDRIQEVRGEIRDARRNARDAGDALDMARREEDRVRYELSRRYPV